jgi:hypothetical protein
MQQLAQVNAIQRGFQPASPVSCDDLTSGSERTFTATLAGPGCHEVIGISRDGTDLDLRVFDQNGQLVVEDVLTDNYPIVNFCGTGTFTVKSRMYESSSHYGVQAFTGGPPPAGQPAAPPQSPGVLHAVGVQPGPAVQPTAVGCAEWVPAQVQTLAMQSARGGRAESPLNCGQLARDAETRLAVATAAGCHVLVGAGPAGADFDLFVYDAGGNQIASDEAVSNTATVRFCSQGPVTVRTRMYQSEGPYGFQVFSQ